MGNAIVVGADFDDVIFPWYHNAHEICVRAGLGMSSEVIPETWSPHEEYLVTLDQWMDALGAATLTGELHSGDPSPGAIEALIELRDRKVEIHIITARGFMQHGDKVREQTEEWLLDWNVPHDGLHFTKNKPGVAGSLGVTHFIDDNVGNVRAMLTEQPKIRTYLQDRPWNRDPGFPVRRVKDMTEFNDAVLRNGQPWWEENV